MNNSTEYVECAICGKKLKELNSHLKVHNMRMSDYIKLYPNCPIISEKTKKLKSIKQTENLNRLGYNYEFVSKPSYASYFSRELQSIDYRNSNCEEISQ